MNKKTADNFRNGCTVVLTSPYIMTGKEYYDRYMSGTYSGGTSAAQAVPEKIRRMLEMFEYGDRSFLQKCSMFLKQGIFMEDYEDRAMWYGDLRRAFPVYHDLNVRQLRGYFAWRALIRKGRYEKTCESFAYIYIYELLNGIGTASPEHSLEKLEEFYTEYIEPGLGDLTLKRDLRKWIREYAIIYGLPAEHVRRYAEGASEERARAVSALRFPGSLSDEVVFSALAAFSGSRISSSPVISKYKEKGKHLFAEVWRHMPDSVFTSCFGELRSVPWHPLASAVYLERRRPEDREYVLDSCRKYTCEDGVWHETGYFSPYADRDRFISLMHVTDMKLRRLLHTGHYLRGMQGEEWAEECVGQALQKIKAEAAEAARPKISIDISGLDRIRMDAGVTRDSLLTEDELLPELDEEQPEGRREEDDGEPVLEVLRRLLAGKPADRYIEERHLMPEIVADTANERFYDDIGDNVIECGEEGLSLVDDYIEDLKQLIEGEQA